MLPRPAVPAIAPFEYCLQIPHDPRAVGVARASLRSTLSAHELPELIDRAELLVSELDERDRAHAWTCGPAPDLGAGDPAHDRVGHEPEATERADGA